MNVASIPYRYAQENEVVITEKEVYFTAATPVDALIEAQRVVSRSGTFELIEVETDTIKGLLERQYQAAHENSEAYSELSEKMDLAELAAKLPKVVDLADSGDDAPIILLINKILAQAIATAASDIHIEPQRDELVIRFRLDGVLRRVASLPFELTSFVVSRIKVMSRLDIAETRLPQDGRLTRELAGKAVDMRVAVVPSGSSERVVIRLLDNRAGALSLEKLGMPAEVLSAITRLIAKPNGIVLTTGPTNSGKTTTLYAALRQVSDEYTNIMTIEDPVEYELPGVSQTSVNSKSGMTFEKGLRALLRQDPDVVMIGEIRDLETARVAIQAAQTGHLVFSTLHTNSAVSALTRLKDMGVEPYLIASSLTGVLAQRLVRVLCDACKTLDPESETYVARGCSNCDDTGYRGRVGIYELIEITAEIRDLIHDGASEAEVLKVARKTSAALYTHGLSLVQNGVTSLAELHRVCDQADHG